MNVQQCGCPSSTSQAQVVVALSTQGWMLHVLADSLLVDVTWLRHGQGHDMAGAGQASSAALSAESIAHQAAAPDCRRDFQRNAFGRIIQRKPASGQELLTRGASMRFHALPGAILAKRQHASCWNFRISRPLSGAVIMH